jgi:hypothetical protein
MHAAATSSTLDAGFGYNGLWSDGKATGKNDTAETTKETKSQEGKSDDSTDREKKTARWKWSSGNPDGK